MSGVPGDLAHWQQQLADALNQIDPMLRGESQFVAAVLVPVLRAYGDVRAAHALTDAADEIKPISWSAARRVRDRAAELLARTDTEGADDGRC